MNDALAPLDSADILMTSPPYGDNKTTVPYGQHSYLPLRWIDSKDLPEQFTPELLESTARIDSLSLGGSLVGADAISHYLEERSPTFSGFLPRISQARPIRVKVLAFLRDYDSALRAAVSRVREDGFCFFTLGERRVGGHVLPLVRITQELLESADSRHVTVLERKLPMARKRMAARNSEGSTMSSEYVLVSKRCRPAEIGGDKPSVSMSELAGRTP